MGYDGDIILFCLDDYFPYVYHELDKLAEINKYMGSSTPSWIQYKMEKLKGLISWKEELKKPSEINEDRLGELFIKINYDPLIFPKEQISYHLWGWKTQAIIEVYIPDFLKDYSKNACELWRKLTGNNYVSNIKINNEEFLFKRAANIGFIYGNELEMLANELTPILQYTNEFYESLEEDYKSSYGVKLRLIELVYTLCVAGENKNKLLAYLGYY